MKIKDFLGKEWDIECMGCAVSSGAMQVPAGFICKGQYFCVHQDPLIPLPGFVVIAARRHIRSMAEMEAAEFQELAGLVWATHAAIKAVTQVEYLTMVQEESSRHFHLWFFPWTQEVVERYEAPSLAKIRGIMADYQTQTLGGNEWGALKSSIEEMRRLMGAEG